MRDVPNTARGQESLLESEAGEHWREVFLGDVAAEITVGFVGSMVAEYVEAGIPFLRSLNVDPLRINRRDMRFISDEFHQCISKSRLSPGDVVIVRTGKPGACAAIPSWLPEANCSDLVIVRCGKEIDHRFLVYYVNTAANEHIAAHLVGAVQEHFNVSSARSLRINLPSLREQEAIVGVLDALDSKVDLLHRQNQTLEAMAETLFRQWFDQDAATDWPEGVVEDLFVLQRGFDLPVQERRDGPHPVVSSSGVSGGHAEYKAEAPGVTTGRSGLIGKVFLVQDHYWPLNTSLYVKEFRRGSPLFSYFFLKAMDLSAFNAGSAVPTLNRNHVHAQRAPLPPRELVERFDAVAWPLFHKIRHNDLQAVQLEKLRDNLLPKLMSGEVRVAF